MAKIIDEIKSDLVEKIFTQNEIDVYMEKNQYQPVECDTEAEEGILKYGNNRSELWLKYLHDDSGDYLVTDVTRRTKKTGTTKVHALKNMQDIKNIMDYFRGNMMYDWFMVFVLEILLARRIGDTLRLKWGDFYYENGAKKDILNTIVEEKTDKIVEISVTDTVWKYLDWFCETKNINPTENLQKDLFPLTVEINSMQDYCKEKDKQEAKFRYALSKATKAFDIKGISTHSLRKTFGFIAHQINQFDPDCLPTLQTIFGHDSVETTKIYIDILDEKGKKYFGDVGNYISDIDNGIMPTIDNVPVVAFKTNNIRDLLVEAYKLGMENKDNPDSMIHAEAVNSLVSKMEKTRIQ